MNNEIVNKVRNEAGPYDYSKLMSSLVDDTEVVNHPPLKIKQSKKSKNKGTVYSGEWAVIRNGKK